MTHLCNENVLSTSSSCFVLLREGTPQWSVSTKNQERELFTYLTVHLLKVCQGTPFLHERALSWVLQTVPSSWGKPWVCRTSLVMETECVKKMCYSHKTIAFVYNTFSLGFLLGTWRNVLTQEANLEPQTKWPAKCAKDRPCAPPDREKQNKQNWGFMNTVGYPCVSWFLWCIWGWEKQCFKTP